MHPPTTITSVLIASAILAGYDEETQRSGAGGYLALQSLAEVSPELTGACLVEGRLVLHEPQSWFGGSNFLRSKFPLLI